jgi:glyoxylase-like metal-dependent hydrolase (beta-lactamase superfamily II)
MPWMRRTLDHAGRDVAHRRTRSIVPSAAVTDRVVDVIDAMVGVEPANLRAMSDWTEIGDRVFVRRYAFYDQNIGVVLGDGGVLLVDTRISHRQAEETIADLRALTPLPVRVVINTHGHSDHCFGNHVVRPTEIWGHDGCVTMITSTGERQRSAAAAALPDLAAELAEVVLDPPDRTFAESATVEIDPGGRSVELRHLGRGHTDNDIVVVVPDADVLFAGDLLENDATPFFGDSFPIDWPGTVERLVELATGTVVPGHGSIGDRGFAVRQMTEFRAVAELARLVDDGRLSLDAAVLRTPYPADTALQPLTRALAQLRGELD